MLIKIFGIWLVASNITYMDKELFDAGKCDIYFSYNREIVLPHSCDEVADEIDQQMRVGK